MGGVANGRADADDGHRRAVARLKGSERPPIRTVRATSAGGIVIRRGETGPQLVLGRRRRARDGVTWTLPKGTPNAGETIEQTALREVAEETGLEVEIVGPAGPIDYWFVQGGVRIHKTVHYFLMQPKGGDLASHDHEFDEVRWFDLAEADRLLTFETERAIVAQAAPAIASLA